MLPFNHILMPSSIGYATVGYSVTIPAFPHCPAAVTDIPSPQTYFNCYSAESFKKWKLEKRNALERQVCELVKKYGTLETDGKEVLGWYILLSSEDRAIIKECGNLPGFFKSNPYLHIVNNRVRLKDKSTLSIFGSPVGGYYSSKYNQEITDNSEEYGYNMDHPESTDLPVVYSDAKLYTHEDANVHFKMHSREDKFCFGQASCLKPLALSSKLSEQQNTRPTSMVFRQEAMPFGSDIKIKDVSFPPSAFFSTLNAKDTMNQPLVEPHCSSTTQNVGANQITISDRSLHSYLKPVNSIKKLEETIEETWNAFDYTQLAKDNIVSGSKEKCLDFEKPGKVVPEKNSQNVCQWQKQYLVESDKLLDQECSASDICDDETFLSIKSGSYSRSSSNVSVDDNTDTESCLFEEALEDLSSIYFPNQKNNVHGLLSTFSNTDKRSAVAPLDVDESLSNMMNLKINSSDITAKTHRNVSCNTDFSWLSDCCSDKETQTKQVEGQERSVNTDLTFGDNLTQNAENVGSGDYREYIEDFKRNKHFSSIFHEALKQRAVKAELQLLDFQRLTCWQLCWETQQQCMGQQSMHTASADHSQDVVCFNLLLALAEVEEKYLEIKKQIQSGVPLDSLVPLSMQLTKVKPPPNNLNKCFTEICQLKMQNGPADHPENLQKSKAVENNPENTCLSSTEDLKKEGSDHDKFFPAQKRCYVLLGNIAPSVNEVDLKTAFAKFQVSSIFLEESSLTSSYAVLDFSGSEEALAAVKEMNGKMFFGKILKARVLKTFPKFQFGTVTEEKATLDTSVPQRHIYFQSQADDVGVFAKPSSPNNIQSGSYWDNVKKSSLNMPHTISFPGENQTFSSAPANNGSALFDCKPPSSQWQWNSVNLNRVPCNSIPNPTPIQYPFPKYMFPCTYPFSFHTPINPISKPWVNFIGKSFDFALPPLTTGRIPVHNNPRYFSSGNSMCNKGTSAENSLPRKPTAQPVIESASVISRPSENKHSSLDLASTPATSSVSSTSPIAGTAACKMPVISESLLAHENKTIDTSEKPSFKPAAPLRFPMFFPDSVTIPESSLLTKTSKSDHQQTESLPLEEEEWGVLPKLDPRSELPVYMVPNRLNLSQFNKVMNFLLEHHEHVSRDDVVEVLEEIRIGKGGSFGCLTIPQIVKEAALKLEAKK